MITSSDSAVIAQQQFNTLLNASSTVTKDINDLGKHISDICIDVQTLKSGREGNRRSSNVLMP